MLLQFYFKRIGRIQLSTVPDSDHPSTPLRLLSAHQGNAFRGRIAVQQYQSSAGPLCQVHYTLGNTVTLDHQLAAEGLKMLLVTEGRCLLETDRPACWHLSAGKICFFNATSYRLDITEDCPLSCFVFPLEAFLEQIDWNGFPENCYELSPAMYGWLNSILQPPAPLYDPEGWLTLQFMNLLQPLREQIHQNLPSGKIKGREPFVYAADAFIQRNLSKHLSIREIAREVGLNESTLKAAYVQHFKMGMIKRQNCLRVDLAKQLLQNTEQSIEEIAFACGYESAKAFRYNFREETNSNPREWRKNLLP